MNAYGQLVTQRVQDNLLANSQNSVFLDSCNHHCGAWGSIVINGDNQAAAFSKWYYGVNKAPYFQNQAFPCASCCQA
jgi:hypothetical protein